MIPFNEEKNDVILKLINTSKIANEYYNQVPEVPFKPQNQIKRSMH